MSVVSRARRRTLVVLGVVLVGMLAATAVAHHHLFGQLTRIEGAFAGLTHRPAPADDGSLTVLVIGADQRPETGASGRGWLPGAGATAVLVVHLSPDRVSARVASLPLERDIASAVNAGPAAAVGEIEEITGVRVDHLAVLDWSVLAQLPGASRPVVGPVGDATARAAADQAYLREVTEDSLHTELRKQPRTLYHLATLTAGALAVDDDWSSFGLARFVVSLRNLRSGDISFVVASGQSVRDAA